MRPSAAVTVATRYSYSWPWWSRVMVSVDSSRHSTRPAEVAATVRNSWRSCWHTVSVPRRFVSRSLLDCGRSRDNLVRDRLFAFQSIALDATLLILINRSFILNAARPYIVSCFRCLRSVTVDISARSLLKFCSTRNFTMI